MKCLDSDSAYYAFLEVLRLHYRKNYVQFEKIGLTHGQPFLLFALNNSDGQSQKELASKLKIKAATMTAMLKRMEQDDLISRKQDDVDQRVIRVCITEKGKAACNRAKEVSKEIEKEMFKDITAEEKMILRRLFMQMKANLQELTE